ncbi:Catenin (Cadherin-associated protein) beta 1 [Fasciola gigantica]|uniref:Catenin (Cadherin-associated protein) beta 1 n=1 Tax=Fasciola gigantica TaxID=46835 RepID=A0A504YIK6_FASGI|nr:Catenin (Cadherin-associated protein) beta 1 [Fasciola gigantica]
MDSEMAQKMGDVPSVAPAECKVSSSQPLEKCQDVKLWQQSHYMADSGIHSALGTHTPSLSGKLGVDDVEGDDHYQRGCSFNQWPSFPLSANPGDSSLLSPATPSTGSVMGVDNLGDTPSGSHSTSNVDLRGNKLPDIDTDEAASAIPDLVKLIKDEDDQVIIYQSSMMVFQLSKSEAIDALIRSNEMIECIISALDRTDDPETVRLLSGTLYNMSQTQTGLKAIFATNCVPCLVKLLNSPIESVLFYAITTLHNLLLHQEGAKSVVRQSGCLQKMTVLLRKNNIKFLTICTDCLQILAYGHQESKLQILSSGGPVELVRILGCYQYEKLLWTTARVLKVLSVCTSNKPAIISAGGMEALAKHLHSSSHRLVLNCLWALRNLSDAATRLDNLHPLLHSLVQLLDCGDSSMVTCAAGILSNLTCNNHTNKFIVHKLGGIQALLRAVGQVGAKEDILEPCMCALRHLTSRHEDEETARHIIVHELAGLPVVARILHAATAGICQELGLVCQPPQLPVTSWMLIKAMVGLLRNLSVNLDSHSGMREYGLVTGLFLLLYATQHEIIKRSSFNGSNGNPPFATMVQSVRLEEIVEGICGALHMLAKDYATRSYLALLKAPNLAIAPNVQPGGPGVSIFVHLLYSAHESIQRAAAGVLAEVSLDRDGLDALANLPGASTRFNELVHSRNEAIATYASAVVIRLTEERKVASGTACMFPPHVEVLNTPPLPMDMGGPIQAPQIQQAPPIGGACPLSSMSHSTWSHQFSPGPMSQDPMHATSSPPPNSLTEMLGPPPAAYKGSTCTGYCGYWSDCGSVGGCSDPNCIYMEHCGSSYCGVSPIRPVRPDTLSTVPVYPHCGSTYAPQGSHPIPLDPGLSTVNPPPVAGSTTLTLGGGTASTRKSGYTSLDTSGYMSPSNEMYIPQPSSNYKPVSNVPLMRHSRAAAVLPVQTNSAESSSSPVITSGTGYLSPELMSLDDPNSNWLTSQNLL